MKRFLLIGGVALIAIVGSASVYTVDETEQAVVFQLGQAIRAEQEAGLKFKLPFIQNVEYYDSRILNVDPPAEQVNLLDQRRLNVDAFTRYRIIDPLAFYQSVRDEQNMAANLSRITNSALRDVLGTVTQADLLSDARGDIMARIRESVSRATERFGIEVLDVRIVRADVPETTVQSVFARMRSEREREAAEARAQGEELSAQIRSRADRDRTVLLAEAGREAEILRGQGDAEAIAILAEAYGADPAFYAFYRSMEAYREALADDSTTLVLSPTSEFFRFFLDPTAAQGSGSGLAAGWTGGQGVEERRFEPPVIESSPIEMPPTEAPPLDPSFVEPPAGADSAVTEPAVSEPAVAEPDATSSDEAEPAVPDEVPESGAENGDGVTPAP